MGAEKLTKDEELIRGIVQASLELACLRHDLCLPDGPPMVVEQCAEIVEDTWNALRGIDTCAEEPAKEFTALVNALKQSTSYTDEEQRAGDGAPSPARS